MREWAVVDPYLGGRIIHIDGATSPADVMAATHGHGTHGPVGVAWREDRDDAWTVLPGTMPGSLT